jgi:hypothetical protein
MVTLQREATGLVILQVSEHLWPEDLERLIPVFHAAPGVGRKQLHPLLLLVRPAPDFIGSDRDVLQEILQPRRFATQPSLSNRIPQRGG